VSQIPPTPPTPLLSAATGDAGITGEHLHDLTALYALGALEPSERDRVDRHVATCVPCAQMLAADQHTVGLLPFLSESALPRPTVKELLFTRVAEAQRLSGRRSRRLWRRPVPNLTIPASTERPVATDDAPQRWGMPRLLPSRRRSGWTGTLLPLAMVPLVLALALTGMWGMRLRDQVNERENRMDELEAQINNLGSYVVDPSALQMTAGSSAPDASGRIVVEDGTNEATLIVQMNETTANRAYDVYVNKDGSLVPAGEVQVDDKGFGVATIPLDEPFANYERVQVEAKPSIGDGADGQDADTGDGLLTWEQQQQQRSLADTEDEPTP